MWREQKLCRGDQNRVGCPLMVMGFEYNGDDRKGHENMGKQ